MRLCRIRCVMYINPPLSSWRSRYNWSSYDSRIRDPLLRWHAGVTSNCFRHEILSIRSDLGGESRLLAGEASRDLACYSPTVSQNTSLSHNYNHHRRKVMRIAFSRSSPCSRLLRAGHWQSLIRIVCCHLRRTHAIQRDSSDHSLEGSASALQLGKERI